MKKGNRYNQIPSTTHNAKWERKRNSWTPTFIIFSYLLWQQSRYQVGRGIVLIHYCVCLLSLPFYIVCPWNVDHCLLPTLVWWKSLMLCLWSGPPGLNCRDSVSPAFQRWLLSTHLASAQCWILICMFAVLMHWWVDVLHADRTTV